MDYAFVELGSDVPAIKDKIWGQDALGYLIPSTQTQKKKPSPKHTRVNKQLPLVAALVCFENGL